MLKGIAHQALGQMYLAIEVILLNAELAGFLVRMIYYLSGLYLLLRITDAIGQECSLIACAFQTKAQEIDLCKLSDSGSDSFLLFRG